MHDQARAPILALVSFRKILPLLAVLALLFAPLRMWGGGEAVAMPGHEAQAVAGEHCPPPPQQAPDNGQRPVGVDCMVGCAATACGAAVALERGEGRAAAYDSFAPTFFAGTAPGSDPPPPRLG